eukprot:CAMPEP_0117758908 /NCGR_PEP_ID=MMETSP0947-20121206/15682_1 /TAXON_ID=44440 /ORGANISM="Chattonella subsalsa, Strain CCMP2191" /LENGTH=154 /DNA_ID=CAMNT_0005579233 /DNA_START=199 /DNA_END=663 /DNA_ORIENTATION=+
MRIKPLMRMLYNMKVLSKKGTISETEWRLIRLYMTLHFKKQKKTVPAKKKKSKILGKGDKERALRIAEEILKNELPPHEWETLSRNEREQMLKKKRDEILAKAHRESLTDDQSEDKNEANEKGEVVQNDEPEGNGIEEDESVEVKQSESGGVVF